MRIIGQTMTPEGVVTEFEDGSTALVPYLRTETGQTYVDLFPNENPVVLEFALQQRKNQLS